MPLQFTQRKEEEVARPTAAGKVNPERATLKDEMRKLASGMVLEIETGSETAVRGTKMMVTKVASELGSKWRHWNVGTKVFAQPFEAVRRRGKPKNN